MTRLFRACVAALLGAVACGAAADTLYLRGGEQELGRLKQMTPDAVVFEDQEGAEKTLPKSEVRQVRLQRARPYDEIVSAAQITDPDLKACLAAQPAADDYPADGFVILLQRKTYDLTDPGAVKETARSIIKVLRQRGEDVASQSVWYFEDTDQPEINYALTVTPDGRVLHLSDSAVKKESMFAGLPQYRRLARYRFACKEPRPGSVLDMQHTVVRRRDPVLEPFYVEEPFRAESPILRKEVVVLLNRGAEATLRTVIAGTDPAAGLVRKTVDESGPVLRIVFTLEERQPGIIQEPLMPPRNYFVPYVTLAEARDWADIGPAYYAALRGAPALSAELKAKAVEMHRQGGPEAIYAFVTRNIRLAPVPQNQYRLTPHGPDETVQRGIANELDKNFLYYKLLEAAGVPCAFALVRDRPRGLLVADAPSIRAFNRTAVYLPGAKRFSNAGSDLLAFDALDGALQGAPALVVGPAGTESAAVPQAAPSEELQATRFDAALDADGNLEMTQTYSGRGNTIVWLRSLKSLDAQQLRNQMELLAGTLHPAAALEDFKTTDLADLAAPPELTLRVRIPGFAVKAGDDLLLCNIPGVAYSAGDVGRPTREHGLFWSHVYRAANQGVLRLPEGYRVYSRPGKVRFNTPTVSYRAGLRKRSGELVFSDTLDLKVASAPAAAYPDYKKAQELRADLARQRVILTRTR